MTGKILFILLLLLAFIHVMGQPAYDRGVLDEMIAFNKAMKSDRLVVSVHDTLIADMTFRGRPDDRYLLYSITKVFSGIAIGMLIDKKLIEHPEIPVATYFDDWKQDTLKSKITIRHILQHTSGLDASRGSQDIYPQPDYVQFALNSAVVTEPGHTFFYNNRAINIIPGIVQKVTGKSMASFIEETVFHPLGITDYEWRHDGAGNTWGMDGLWLNATDLMKVSQLLCNLGEWRGRRIVSRAWCELMFQMPLVNAMNGKYGYAMAIRSLPFQEAIAITPETTERLISLGLPEPLAHKLKKFAGEGQLTYPEFGKRLAQTFTPYEVEELSSFASRQMIPLYIITNGNYYILHGGEYGLLMAAFPKRKKAVVRYLGEKWGRQMKKDGSGYKYLIDDELIRLMLRL